MEHVYGDRRDRLGFSADKRAEAAADLQFHLGRVTSDAAAAGRIIQGQTGKEIAFLRDGRLNAVAMAAR